LIAIVCCFFLGWAAAALQAQEVPRFDVFGGYSDRVFDAKKLGYPNYSNLYGWNFAATGHVFMKYGVVVDASGDYGSQLRLFNYLIGPQYTRRREKSDFDFHFLYGKAQTRVNLPQLTRSGFESVGRSMGGGLDFNYHWKPRISFRVGADYFRSRTFSTTQNDGRASVGLVFHFGHMGHRRKL
jgi:hypothetical protein